MPVVTALRPARRRGYVELEIDGASLGLLSEREVLRLSLKPGMAIDDDTLAAARNASQLAGALVLANAYLAHRPRTTAEVRIRLSRAGHDEDVVAAAIAALEAQGLLDDRRFATLWVENRSTFNPRSPRLIEMELRRKGVDRQTAAESLAEGAGGDENALALEAGRKRLRSFSSLDEDAFRRRMGGFLARRGFTYEVVAPVLDLLWGERETLP